MKINKNVVKVIATSIALANIAINSFANNIDTENKYSNEINNIKTKEDLQKSAKEAIESEELDVWLEGFAGVSQAKNALRSIAVDGKIYCIGGFDGTTRLNTVEEYDPKRDTWTTKSPMPTGRSSFGISEIDGKIYCIGGQGSSNLNVVEVYDPKEDTWDTSKAPMPTARRDFKSFVLDGKIYCIGGNNGSYLNTVEVYDPKEDTWDTSKAPLPIAVGRFEGEVFDNKIYCISGMNSSQTKAVQVYDATTDNWEFKTDIPTPRTNFGSAIIEGKIYCIGGTNRNHLNLVEVYDIETDTWETKAPMPTVRNGFATAILDGKIYVIAGYNGSRLTKVERYTPEEYPIYQAGIKVSKAEEIRDRETISDARDTVNKLTESDSKKKLQERLNKISIDESLERYVLSSNFDVYIKSENLLSISLNTNSVIFDGYSGVEEMKNEGAVTLSINSSLPYTLNSYLATDIKSVDGENTIDASLMHIRDNSEPTYQNFINTVDEVVLKDNCPKGNGNSHIIDLKLTSNNAHKANIYKSVIRFEAVQK